jgi:hypothetical protein
MFRVHQLPHLEGQRSDDMQTACHRVPRSLQSTAQQESNAPQLTKAKTSRLHTVFSPDALKLHSFELYMIQIQIF